MAVRQVECWPGTAACWVGRHWHGQLAERLGQWVPAMCYSARAEVKRLLRIAPCHRLVLGGRHPREGAARALHPNGGAIAGVQARAHVGAVAGCQQTRGCRTVGRPALLRQPHEGQAAGPRPGPAAFRPAAAQVRGPQLCPAGLQVAPPAKGQAGNARLPAGPGLALGLTRK